jgi:hypothetical protein
MIPITISAEDCCYQNKRIEEMGGGGDGHLLPGKRKVSGHLLKYAKKNFA